jgi:18S rRNA (adenine1779-N6/adenine1780-N6)-dimethyltransferase
VRKNKTLGAAFSQTAVLLMLEKNFKIHCSLRNEPVDPDLVPFLRNSFQTQ